MFGRIARIEEKGWRVHRKLEQLGGLILLRVDIPSPWTKGKLQAALTQFRRAGVRRVLAPQGFGHWEIFHRGGISGVETGAFCQMLAPRLALAALAHRGLSPSQATVALRGERVTPGFARCALELCPRVRQLVISAPVGGEALEVRLWQEFGLPTVTDRLGTMPHLALHFAPVEGRGEQTLALWGEAPKIAPLCLNCPGRDCPEGCAQIPLLAAWWETGHLMPEEVEVCIA